MGENSDLDAAYTAASKKISELGAEAYTSSVDTARLALQQATGRATGTLYTDPKKPHFDLPDGSIKTEISDWEYTDTPTSSEEQHVQFPSHLIYKAQPSSVVHSLTPVKVGVSGGHISPPAPGFVYIDTGLWAGDGSAGDPVFERRRDFTLIFGGTAALCSFRPRGSPSAASIPSDLGGDAQVLNKVLKTLKEVEVVAWASVPAPRHNVETARDEVFVILPDMHLPILTAQDAHRNPSAPCGRSIWSKKWDSTVWLSLYQQSDIFQGAAGDLGVFLTRLQQFGFEHPTPWPSIHLVQVGDLFDMWLGLDRFFQDDNNPACPGVQVVPGSGGDVVIDYWTTSTLISNPNKDAISQLLQFPFTRSFLWGNHDNYYSPSGHEPRVLTNLSGGRRVETVSVQRHLFIEHGHRPDSWNRDGETKGHLLTQAALTNGTLVRAACPMYRLLQIEAAAKHWLSCARAGAPYLFYVMGHSHIPVFCNVGVEALVK